MQPDAVTLASARICKKIVFDLRVTIRGKEYVEIAIGETAHAWPLQRGGSHGHTRAWREVVFFD